MCNRESGALLSSFANTGSTPVTSDLKRPSFLSAFVLSLESLSSLKTPAGYRHRFNPLSQISDINQTLDELFSIVNNVPTGVDGKADATNANKQV